MLGHSNSVFESIYCRNLGAYLAYVSDFCSRSICPTFNNFRLIKSAKPKLLESNLVYEVDYAEDLLKKNISLNDNVFIRYKVPSILDINNKEITVLINKQSGSFFEISKNLSSSNEIKNYLTNLDQNALIGLFRHDIIHIRDINLKTQSVYPQRYIFEFFVAKEFFEKGGFYVFTNRLNGIRVKVQLAVADFLFKNKIIFESVVDNIEFLSYLNSIGILRSIN